MTLRSFARSRRVQIATIGTAALAVAGGATAYAATVKTVSVSVDGVPRSVSLHGGTVRDVLAQAHLQVGSHDLLAPAPGTPIRDGSRIVLRRGRPMTLVVDGVTRTVWVTASSVDEALGQVGLRLGTGDLLSADRSREIPLKGFSLDVRTRKDVRLLVAGKLQQVATTGLTVQDALRTANVAVRPADTLSPPLLSPLHNGEQVTVTPLDARQQVVDVVIPSGTTRRDDGTAYLGTTRQLEPGRAGNRHQTFLLSFVNGKPAGRRLLSVQTVAPISQVLAVGTKARPVPRPAPATAPAPARQSAPSSSGGLNWSALANCESGGNPRAVSSNGSYRGLYQFSFGTWGSVGGSGDPIDASPSEQTNRAQILYSRTGPSSWPVCGKYL